MFAAGAPSRTPLGSLQRSPTQTSYILVEEKRGERKGKEMKGKEGRERQEKQQREGRGQDSLSASAF